MNGRDTKGAVAALASVAKLPFRHAHDGISYTFAVSPETLGKERNIQLANMVGLLDGYFTSHGGQHLNVNVFDKDLLVDAMNHPANMSSWGWNTVWKTRLRYRRNDWKMPGIFSGMQGSGYRNGRG